MCDMGGGSTENELEKERTGTTRDSSSEQRERLEISDEAVDKIVDDMLSRSGSGIKDIFAGEQTAGIFGSSVAAQAAGDLAANIAGEIAKLRAERVTTDESEEKEHTKRQKDRMQLETEFNF